MSIRATFSYFQGMEGDMYQFYRIPKLLFTSEYFKNLSCEAKVLYAYRQIICENIEYDILCQSYKPESVEELVELMLDAICTTKKYLQINGEAMPAQVVKNRLLKVGYEHIQYVFFSLSKNTTKVKNIRQYMLTVLYNAPVTINQFYDAEVRHDMYGG